jgi:hypothetical protein
MKSIFGASRPRASITRRFNGKSSESFILATRCSSDNAISAVKAARTRRGWPEHWFDALP